MTIMDSLSAWIWLFFTPRRRERLLIGWLHAAVWKTLPEWVVHATAWRTVSDLSAPRFGVGNVFWLIRSKPRRGLSTTRRRASTPRIVWVVMTRSAFHKNCCKTSLTIWANILTIEYRQVAIATTSIKRMHSADAFERVRGTHIWTNNRFNDSQQIVDALSKRTMCAIDSVRCRSRETSERQSRVPESSKCLRKQTSDRIPPYGDGDDLDRWSVNLYKLAALSSFDVLFGANRRDLVSGERASRVHYDDQRLFRSATQMRCNNCVFVFSCSFVIVFVTVH